MEEVRKLEEGVRRQVRNEKMRRRLKQGRKERRKVEMRVSRTERG